MGIHDFEIQPKPEPPDPEAERAPVQRTAAQVWVTWLTLGPVVACALLALVYACTSSSDAAAELVRIDGLSRQASASLAPLVDELEKWSHPAELVERAWRVVHNERVAALHGHLTACRILIALSFATLIPGFIIWTRGQWGRREDERPFDFLQVAMCLLAVTVLVGAWSHDARAVSVLRKTAPAQDLGDRAAALVAEAKAERLAPWRKALGENLAVLRQRAAPDAEPSCAADVVCGLVHQAEFELLTVEEKRVLRGTLEILARAYYADAAFEPLARAQEPFAGRDGVEAMLVEHERETRQFASDAEATAYFFDAIRNDNGADVRMMLRRGIDVNVSDRRHGDGYTPLYAAVLHGRPALARLLLEHCARADIPAGTPPARGKPGDFPAHAAVGSPDVMKLLLDFGADPSAANAVGQTPLHYAAERGDRACIKLLVKFHGNINALDTAGQTPLDLANSPLASDAARGAHALLQQLGGVTAADLKAEASSQ